MVPAPQWAPPRERQEGVSAQGCREANAAVGLQCLPSFIMEHIWIKVLQVSLSSISFFQLFTVIPPPIQTICRVCQCKGAEAQSGHAKKHPQDGEDCTAGEDVVLAAALGLIAHQLWHKVQGCKAWFVVTAGYGQVPPVPAKLGCVSTVIPLPTRSQMASPQGCKINNNGRKVDRILGAISLPGVSLRLAPGLLGEAVTKQKCLVQVVCGVIQKQVFLGCKQR